MDTGPLSEARLENIFSQSIGSLLTILTTSFATQKFFFLNLV